MVASELPNASYRSGQARGQESRGFKRARRSTRGDRSAEPNGLSAIDVRRPRHIRCGSSARTEYAAFTSLPPTVPAGEPSRAKTHPERFLEG